MTASMHPGRRRGGGLIAVAMLAAATASLLPASPAAAHHGWDGFETSELLYISGTVSSEGSWGDPHSHFDVTLDAERQGSAADLPITEELSGPQDSIRVEAAPAYGGQHEELEVIIAPPWWSSSNGLDRQLAVGERFQGVGYINSSDDGLFRPVAFWYGQDNAPVNQVIGNTLPVRAPLPGEAYAGGQPEQDPSEMSDPLEMVRPEADDAAEQGGIASWAVWAGFGAVVLAVAAGAVLYLRRRSGHGEGSPDA